MGKDFNRILVDAGRAYRDDNRSRASQKVLDGEATKLSMRKSARWVDRRINQSDYTAPLRRYLRSQVGRPWDAVYSELIESVHGRLGRYHLVQHVEGEVIVPTRHNEWRSDGLYVDSDGILRFRARKPRYVHPPDQHYKKVGSVEYFRANGVWFEIVERGKFDVWAHPGRIAYRDSTGDEFEFTDRKLTRDNLWKLHDPKFAVFGKWRQVGAKDVRRLGFAA